MDDPYNLQRFIEAQRDEIEHARAELRNGQKTSHWMWFIFPQLRGLGSSQMSIRFAISSREEAEQYLSHPVLGPRLTECTELVNRIRGRSIHQVFGSPDDLKFHSSMTLFASAGGENQVFGDALRKFFGGKRDEKTTELLNTDR